MLVLGKSEKGVGCTPLLEEYVAGKLIAPNDCS